MRRRHRRRQSRRQQAPDRDQGHDDSRSDHNGIRLAPATDSVALNGSTLNYSGRCRAEGGLQVRRRPIGMMSHRRHMAATSRSMRGNGPGGINPARIIILLANRATTMPLHTAKNKRRKPAMAPDRRTAVDRTASDWPAADRFPRVNTASITAVTTPPTTDTASSAKMAP
jgi:hypothetical protein